MRESRSDVQGDVQLDFCSGVEMSHPESNKFRNTKASGARVSAGVPGQSEEEGKQCCCPWVMRGCIGSLLWGDRAETKREAEALLWLWDVVMWPLMC